MSPLLAWDMLDCPGKKFYHFLNEEALPFAEETKRYFYSPDEISQASELQYTVQDNIASPVRSHTSSSCYFAQQSTLLRVAVPNG